MTMNSQHLFWFNLASKQRLWPLALAQV